MGSEQSFAATHLNVRFADEAANKSESERDRKWPIPDLDRHSKCWNVACDRIEMRFDCNFIFSLSVKCLLEIK